MPGEGTGPGRGETEALPRAGGRAFRHHEERRKTVTLEKILVDRGPMEMQRRRYIVF